MQWNYTKLANHYNIEKAYNVFPDEGDKKFKRMYQAASPEKRKTMGYDVPNDADAEDLEITRMANKWLRDGNPVD